MNRISTKMKLLSLAILGLGGLALVGSASAACPGTADAWSATIQSGGTVAIENGGLDSSSCKMSAVLNAGGSAFSAATVRDDSPSNEPRYRVQFLINADSLTGLGSFDAAQIASFNSATSYPSTNPTVQVVRLAVSGGSTKKLNIIAACDNGGSNSCAVGTATLASGVNRIELDVQLGTSGSVTYWVNSTTEGSPTGTMTLNNAGWSGVDTAFMGISASTPGFRNTQAGHKMYFDSFDSRRQTFIGS